MKKNKEHKKGESTIGKIIYGFLLFMPLFAIGVTCGYAMFNKNAYQSYGDSSVYENIKIQQSQFNSELKYTAIYNGQGWTSDNTQYTFTYLSLDANDLGITQVEYDSLVKWNWLATNRIQLRNQSGTLITTITFDDTHVNQFEFIGNISPNFFQGANLYQVVITTQTIDKVFYYAVDKVTESPLFSWATNSVIYTTMNATCTQLSITAPFIPLLLSYWLIISVIYFLYDIALMLIWLLHDKIHEMRDSLA